MANITVTEAASFIPQIWAASALGALKANTVMARLVNRNFENEVARQGNIVNIPKRGALVANNKAANGAVTLQIPSASTIAVTLNKYKEVSFLVEDVARAQANQDIIEGYIADGMKKIAEAIDADILALYTGLSTTPINATSGGGGVVAATITEARRILNNKKVPMTDRYIVWGEDPEKELLALAQFTNAQNDPANADALQNATLGRKYGFTHVMDQQVVAAATEIKNIAFHRDCFTLVTRPLPAVPEGMGAQSVVMEEDGVGIRVSYSWNPTYLGVQVTLDVLYGVAELWDEYGLVIRSTDV